MANLIESPPSRSPVDDGARVTRAWESWFSKAYSILFAVVQSGPTANRPTTGLWIGRQYFDTTEGLPIFWDGAQWIDAAGTPV